MHTDLFLLVLRFSLFQLLFAAIPLVFLSLYRRSASLLKLIPVLFAILLVDLIAIFFRPFDFQLHWNWQGKFFEFIWPLFIVFAFHWMTPKEVGYSVAGSKSSWKMAFYLGTGIGLFSIFLNLTLGRLFPSSELQTPYPFFETLAFQATMPGLAEEPLYRGILLALFDRYFNKPWKLFGVKIG